MRDILECYRGKKVLITGHTGFKGSWLSIILQMAGADVIGYALAPEDTSLFRIADVEKGMVSIIGDVRNFNHMQKVFDTYKPEYVFHLAAQPIVRESYKNPVETYSTNVMGTVHLLECVRHCNSVKSVLNVTTDKVYQNKETEIGYVEEDNLDGFDPYSNSKSCSELVTHSYYKSFLHVADVRVSTARAGNVIGGGDFEKDRIIPDCVRAALQKKKIIVRNPNSVRPFQHVLEPIFVYLMIAQKQLEHPELEGAYNVGPEEKDCWTTAQLVDCFCEKWGEGISWNSEKQEGPHEANLLKLDCKKLRNTFAWNPKWDINISMEKIVEWTRAYQSGSDVKSCMKRQIMEYLA